MDTPNTRITIEYEITTYGTATYDEEDSAKIMSYMEETGCYIEEAIEELAKVGAIVGLPEEIGTDQTSSCFYMKEEPIE